MLGGLGSQLCPLAPLCPQASKCPSVMRSEASGAPVSSQLGDCPTPQDALRLANVPRERLLLLWWELLAGGAAGLMAPTDLVSRRAGWSLWAEQKEGMRWSSSRSGVPSPTGAPEGVYPGHHLHPTDVTNPPSGSAEAAPPGTLSWVVAGTQGGCILLN